MTTKTKPPKSTSAPTESIEDLVSREHGLQSVRLTALERRKDELIADNDDLALAPLSMSGACIGAFEDAGIVGYAAIVRCLEKHRSIAEARAAAGDPAKIIAAREALAIAVEAEQTAKAEVADLDADAEGEPILARQIRSLQSRLGTLTAARIDAEQHLAHLVSLRKRLRGCAPKQLLDNAERELTRTKLGSKCWLRLGELRRLIAQFEKVLGRLDDFEHWTADEIEHRESNGRQVPAGFSKFDERDGLLSSHARKYCPAAYNPGGGWASVNRERFLEHAETLRTQTLPALKAEQRDLQAEWLAVVTAIESQLDCWIETGEV